MTYEILLGDCIASMRSLPDQSVNTCVTSPPYFGLRDYGMDGQIGLEATPDAFVARLVDVFREVRRVLRDDGTLWLNLGDSYAANRAYQVPSTKGGAKHGPGQSAGGKGSSVPDGLKQKDLLGIPWRVAFALQQPYYAGRVKAEIDRVWLAAMLDGEGCFYIHRRLAGQHAGDGYFRQSDNYQCAFEIANTSEAIVQRCLDLTGVGSIIRQDKERRQPLFRWTVRSNEAKALIREIYPYLVAKRQQARIAFGVSASGKDAEPAWLGMKALHAGSTSDVDYPAPPSCHEPGWYLRQDIIWSKPNPMPESVRDRCTKAHEYLFLLSKSDRYFFDGEAIKEAARYVVDADRKPSGDYSEGSGRNDAGGHRSGGFVGGETRNRRSVWTVTTKPYAGAHFATFPPDLIEPCILAGSPVGGTVLDPFGGSGTTAGVALKHGRKAILCELNPAYAALMPDRILSIAGDTPDMFREAAE